MSFNLKDIPSQKGKIAIVTGANIGLGFETTIGLANKGMKVIMACRNMGKAETARQEIIKKIPDADLEILQLNLASLESVRDFAKEYTSKYTQLDLLIENAGIMIPPFSKTEDNFESQMGVNYFAHFLLTNLLYPTLNNTDNARIVTLSSGAHKSGKIDFDNLNSEREYSKFGAYAQSKLACLMFAYELQRRLASKGSSVIAVSAHPGVSHTNLGQHVSKWLLILLYPLFLLMMHSPGRAALPTLYAALGSDVVGGEYFGPTGFREMKGAPGKVNSIPASHDEEVASKLWEVSEELTGERFSV